MNEPIFLGDWFPPDDETEESFFVERTALYKAVIQGDSDQMQSLILGKTFIWDFSDNDTNAYTFKHALVKAVELDHKEIVQFMLNASFACDGFGSHKPRYVAEALEMAAKFGRLNIVQQILKTDKDNCRRISEALAHGVWSHNLQLLQTLIDAGASPNCEVTWWGTPLVAAVTAGSLEVVKYLVEAGADPNMRVVMDSCYISALSAAVHDGKREIVEYLLPLTTDPEAIECVRSTLLEAAMDEQD